MSRPPVCIAPARAEDLPALQRIEAAAARLFPAQDLPPALAGQSLPLSVLDAARAAGLLWVVRATPATGELTPPLGFLMAEPGGERFGHLLRHLAEERRLGLRRRLGMVKPLAQPARP